MKTIAAHVEKGGTGKNTTIGNVAYWIAQKDRTVVFDADPQRNLTRWYVTQEMEYEFADLLYGESSFAQTAMMVRENLGVIPTFGIDARLGESVIAKCCSATSTLLPTQSRRLGQAASRWHCSIWGLESPTWKKPFLLSPER